MHDLFDFDKDGSMDIAERAAELGFIDGITDDDEYDDDDDEYDDYKYKKEDDDDDDDEW